MPGGSKESYDALGPLLEKIAAHVDGQPCCAWIGTDGAGHFVKMVHNGIEYADMQVIGEAFDLLRSGAGIEPAEQAKIFAEWNKGDLASFLIEISAEVLGHVDAKTGKPFVDVVVDAAGQKGTGRWTVISALELGSPTSGIAESVFARALSSQAEQRKLAQELLAGGEAAVEVPESFVEDVRQALYASKLVSYAQGLDMLTSAAKEYGWDLKLDEIASLWRGGCIIRAELLKEITKAYAADGEAGQPALRPGVHQGDRRSPPGLAPRGGHRGAARHPGAGVLLLAGLLRRPAPQAPAGRRHPGPARPLRCAHLRPRRRRGHVPHPLGRGQVRDRGSGHPLDPPAFRRDGRHFPDTLGGAGRPCFRHRSCPRSSAPKEFSSCPSP